MLDPIFTIPEQEPPPETHDFSFPAPLIGWSIALLFLGILIGKQIRRQQPSATGLEKENPATDPVSFTQALHWVSYGKEMEKKQQYEAAIAVYDQGLSQHPQDFHLWHERGLAFAKLQQFEPALDSFDRAYRIRPRDGDLAHERGDTLLQLERFEEAIASYDIYLRYRPDSAHILSDRGYALCQLGQFTEALESLNKVFKTDRRDPTNWSQAHYYQIEALRHLGQLEAALRASQTAIEQYGDEHFVAQRETIRQQIAEVLSHAHRDDQPGSA
jgi:tetratricopeptide (TPR) repeat protein